MHQYFQLYSIAALILQAAHKKVNYKHLTVHVIIMYTH